MVPSPCTTPSESRPHTVSSPGSMYEHFSPVYRSSVYNTIKPTVKKPFQSPSNLSQCTMAFDTSPRQISSHGTDELQRQKTTSTPATKPSKMWRFRFDDLETFRAHSRTLHTIRTIRTHAVTRTRHCGIPQTRQTHPFHPKTHPHDTSSPLDRTHHMTTSKQTHPCSPIPNHTTFVVHHDL